MDRPRSRGTPGASRHWCDMKSACPPWAPRPPSRRGSRSSLDLKQASFSLWQSMGTARQST
eukprot:5329686-Pyramimonas_sp.AAC.1